MDRRGRMLEGIAALRDATRALRGGGAARKGEASELERGALFDLAGLADRLDSFAEDQGADDWEQFWVTERDVATLRGHVAALALTPRGLAATTVPALTILATELDALVQPDP
ncbi:MAG: hypothetical protein V4813_08915 [Gemmatimonadota bacterium]